MIMPKASFFLSTSAVLILFVGVSGHALNFSQSSNVQPAVVSAVAPSFPPIARAARAQGEVVVEVRVDAKGNVKFTKVISGHPLLQKVSEKAAMKWKFAPVGEKESNYTAQLMFSYGYIDGDKSEPEYIITFMPPYKVEVKWNPPPPTY